MAINSRAVARRIQEVMRIAGCNQKELATFLNISQPAISLYLRGRVPPAAILLSLAKLGNTSVEWLLTGEDANTAKLQVSETRSGYGQEGKLLEIWRGLDSGSRTDFLRLMQRLLRK